MRLVFVLIALVLGLGCAQGIYTVPNMCQPITIPFCKSLPYNMTRLPNLLYHYTRESVSASVNNEEITALIQTNCSDELVFLICVYHFPICTTVFDKPIPPCRSVCQKVKRECTPTLQRFKRFWPSDVNCQIMPTYEKGVCVKPESFVNQGATDCKCSKDTSMNRKKFRARRFNFAIIAKVNDIIKTANERQILYTHKKTIHKGMVKVAKRRLTMYTNSTCSCPELHVNQTYLLMGHEDTSTGRLLLGPQSFVLVWPKNKKYKQIKRTLRLPMRILLGTLEQEHKRKLKKKTKNLTKNKRNGKNP